MRKLLLFSAVVVAVAVLLSLASLYSATTDSRHSVLVSQTQQSHRVSASVYTSNPYVLGQGSALWLQPVWMGSTNEHGTVTATFSDGGNAGIFNGAGFLAFGEAGWWVPISEWNGRGGLWRLALNYNIQIQQIAFDLGIRYEINPWNEGPTYAIVRINEQEKTHTGVGGKISFVFDFTDWDTNVVEIYVNMTGEILNRNLNIEDVRNLTITATVDENHFSAYRTGRIEQHIQLGTLMMQARDFELISDGGFLTTRLLIGDHPIRVSMNNSQLLVYDYGDFAFGVRRIQQSINVQFRNFWIRFENDRINIWDRFYIPATPETIIEVSTTFVEANCVSSGGGGTTGLIRGWSSDAPISSREFTIFVQSTNGTHIGSIQFEMDLSGTFQIGMYWLVYNLPEIIIGGQSIYGFFLVDRDTGQVGALLIHHLMVSNRHFNYVTIAINHNQMRYTVSWHVQIDGSTQQLHSMTLNWGEMIPRLSETLELPIVRGWRFIEWRNNLGWLGEYIKAEGNPIEQDTIITAFFRRMQPLTIRFQEPVLMSNTWVHHRTIAEVTVYEDEVLDLDEIIAFNPQVPLSQRPPLTLAGDVWDGQWITESGFNVGHILDDKPLYNVEQNVEGFWTFLNFIPNTTPVEFLVSFMGWDGERLAQLFTNCKHKAEYMGF